MRKYINIILLVFGISFFSCEKFLEPQNENSLSEKQVLNDPQYAEGLLLRAYVLLPDDYYFETDVASDDAVTNDMSSNYRRMAVGEWKSSFDPIQAWSTAYEQIYYINKFLSVYDKVVWANDPRLPDSVNVFKNALYKKRLRGEAFAMRAYAKSRLLQYHGGLSEGGQLLGFPIVDQSLDPEGNWKLPRSTFAECVTNIFTDCDSALANLPLTWVNLTSGDATRNGYINGIQGLKYTNRMNGNTVRAIKARVALLAASPAFSATSGITWAKAAELAGGLLKDLPALRVNSSTSNTVAFYKEPNAVNNQEMIWARAFSSKRNWETNNFPPSLIGNGRTNPSQNLVDAFPMANGYPINNPLSGYNPNNPYAGRDVRFNEYIIFDSAKFRSTIIRTYIGAPADGINVQSTSTRTGYYLKKFMSETVNLGSSPVSTNHTYTLFRTVEVLLNFAEAANEAWGPDADGGLGLGTARSKIAALRQNSGIPAADPYLATITTQDQMRALIRNERRITLCFEGFRFWDIRRWGDVATMQSPVKGAYITNAPVDVFNYDNVEERKYTSDQIYGPIPYNETLKYNLQQNKGW